MVCRIIHSTIVGMSTKTVFQKIIVGELPSYKIWEDEGHFAFLDISPFAPGHTLVVPKQPSPYLFDMDDEAYNTLMHASRKVAKILKKAFPEIPRVGVVVSGFGVENHVHIHLIPIRSEVELFGGPKAMSKEEMTKIHKKILEVMERE